MASNAPLRSRSNSMDEVHATVGGGIRSQARLEINGSAHYTDLVNTDKRRQLRSGTAKALFGEAREKHSSNDAEVHVLAEALDAFKQPLRNARGNPDNLRSVKVEYHGNHGPCEDCQGRFEKANTKFAEMLPHGTVLQSSVYYSQAPHLSTRGDNQTYGYEGDKAPSRTYGRMKTPLYEHNLQPQRGTWKPRERSDSAKKMPSDPSLVKTYNPFAALEHEDSGSSPQTAEKKPRASATFPSIERSTAKKTNKSKGNFPELGDGGKSGGASSSSGGRSNSGRDGGGLNSNSRSSADRSDSHRATAPPQSNASWIRWGAGIGAAGGMAVGAHIGRTLDSLGSGWGAQLGVGGYLGASLGGALGAAAGATVGALAHKFAFAPPIEGNSAKGGTRHTPAPIGGNRKGKRR